MKKIISKLVTFAVFPFLMAIGLAVVGLFVSYACRRIVPDLSQFMPHASTSSKLEFEIAFFLLISGAFSLAGWVLSWPLALTALLLPGRREMVAQLVISAKIVLAVMLAGTAATLACSFAGIRFVLLRLLLGLLFQRFLILSIIFRSSFSSSRWQRYSQDLGLLFIIYADT